MSVPMLPGQLFTRVSLQILARLVAQPCWQRNQHIQQPIYPGRKWDRVFKIL